MGLLSFLKATPDSSFGANGPIADKDIEPLKGGDIAPMVVNPQAPPLANPYGLPTKDSVTLPTPTANDSPVIPLSGLETPKSKV